MNKCAIVIPALNPTEDLLPYVQSLLKEGFTQIIVVNDGSYEELTPIFTHMSRIEECKVLTHPINKGKGRALKTAFHYLLKHYHSFSGVITVDADGQHSIEDVCKIAKKLTSIDEGLILGVRDFNDADVPARSILGNRISSFIFHLFFRRKFEDTQTGLRGIPKKELLWIVQLKGERYEYEVNMLINAVKRKTTVYEIPIQTLYFDHNASSHFQPGIDSWRILKKLIRGLFPLTDQKIDRWKKS
ncbi:glycosyltransferase family 2 protein [Bacillus sp. FJAT-49732]|uniref:Glycosyltransferase family 2 protein n=1 Tax=Lederbergia citrisecunda TaxID=2833583 RepID=A0A942TR23_9BACI|nr:glycosyltransferase family 2 protein [Lederbergia citrisecunda]MBS4201331.1 glycosyltransferase family 2 protein [Lederbergia citrisecunda]